MFLRFSHRQNVLVLAVAKTVFKLQLHAIQVFRVYRGEVQDHYGLKFLYKDHEFPDSILKLGLIPDYYLDPGPHRGTQGNPGPYCFSEMIRDIRNLLSYYVNLIF